MQAISHIQGTAVPLERSDIDTDQIIPAEWLKRVERTGFGKGLFEQWRKDPNFILNDPQRSNSPILVAGPNFGTGSSREHAVWALMDYGFKAVVSSRFGDIFQNNCTKNGLLPIKIDPQSAQELSSIVKEQPQIVVSIDVASKKISIPVTGFEASFEMDESTQKRFIEGLDDIGLTLQEEDKITSYEQNRPFWMPSTV